jgi:hypothetical protein
MIIASLYFDITRHRPAEDWKNSKFSLR